MRRLIKIVVNERRVTLFLAAIVAALGVYCYFIIPKQENPDVSSPVALITTIYPGASPEEVEKLVTEKIEDVIPEISGFEGVESQSRNSVSIVIVKLDYKADAEKSWEELRQKIASIKEKLPEGCHESQVDTELTDTAGMIISISGENHSYEELSAFGNDIKRELLRVKGVSSSDVDGELVREVKIDVDIDKLNLLDVSLDDISNILKLQNINIPSGGIKYDSGVINVNTPGRFLTIEDIQNTVIAGSKESGTIVRLKDISKVYMGYQDGIYKYRHNGENAVLLTGYFKDKENIVPIGERVRKELKEIKKQLPSDVKVEEVIFQPQDVGDSIRGFTNNLLQGMLFVIIVVLFGLGIRNALVVSISIPLSVLTTFVFMKIFKIDMHFISIAALIISVGMVVDNSIVVCDSIQNNIDEGFTNKEAAIVAVKETAVPIFTSTLTTVAAFATLITIPGIPGRFLYSVPIVVITALIASYVVAMLVVPAIASKIFKVSKAHDKKFKKMKVGELIRKVIDWLLFVALKQRILTIAIAFFILGISVLLIPKIGLQFFPLSDKKIIYININSEILGSLENTENIALAVENIIKNEKEVKSYTMAIGNGIPKFYLTMPISVPAKDFAQILIKVDLKKTGRFKDNSEFVSYLQEILNKEIVGGSVMVKALEYTPSPGAPITIKIKSDDFARLKEVSNEIQGILEDIPGTTGVRDDYKEPINEYFINIDNTLLSFYGFTKYDVSKQINTALSGNNATVYIKNGKEYGVVVKGNIKSVEELSNMAIKSSFTGKKLLLKQIADIRLKPSQSIINHDDGETTISVYSDVKPGYSSVSIQNIFEKDKIKNLDLKGVDIKFKGEKADIADMFDSMIAAGIFAVALIYVILLIEFKSFLQPLAILFTIPLSFIGCIAGLYIFKKPLSVTAAMGIVSLMGIVVNNAIILIDFINMARKEGHSLDDACKEAVGKRIRPILLTTITTVIGLIPLIFSGNPMFVPMGVTLMCGLLVSTILTLIVIPAFYNIIENPRRKNIPSA